MPVHPALTYRDLDAGIRFLTEAFGFDLVDSGVDSAGLIRFASLRYPNGLVLP